MKTTEKEIDRLVKKHKRRKIRRFLFIAIGLLLILLFYPILIQHVRNYEIIYKISILFYLGIIMSVVYYTLTASTSSPFFGVSNKSYPTIWVDNIRDYNPMSEFIYSIDKNTTMENLIFIKDNIIKYCKHDNMNLKLLRSYYYTLKINNEQIMWQTIIGLCVLTFSYLLKGVISEDFSLSFLGITFSPFELLISFITLLFLTYKNILSKRDKHLLIYKIIDELIDSNEGTE